MKLSIITVNYNDCDGLRKTIESVANQTCHDFEYLVIDGGSTDGSVEVIKQNEKAITYWVSEKDKGIYHAMNKGVSKSTGDFCLFMNSGDWLNADDVVETVLPYLNDEADVLMGYVRGLSVDGIFSRLDWENPPSMSSSFLMNYTLSHQSSFIRRTFLLKYPYDENLKIVSDWKFWIQCFMLDNARYKHLDYDVAVYCLDGISYTSPNVMNERTMVLDELSAATSRLMVEDLKSSDPDMMRLFASIYNVPRLRKCIVKMTALIIRLYRIFKPLNMPS